MSVQKNLALQRTRLANERTLLAYVRTFMGFLGLGIALIAVFDSTISSILGGASIAAGAFVMVVGVISHIRNRSALVKDEHDLQERTGAG
jgi:putative membrane protein